MMSRISKIAFICLVLFMFNHSGWAYEKPMVFVSIAPQKYFVQQIGKGLVDVTVLVEPGASPHTYEPKPQQMAALSRARLYFAIGVEFEKAWLPKIAAANPHMQIVYTDHDIHKIPMAAHHHHHDAAHEDKSEHHHAAHGAGESGQAHHTHGHTHHSPGHDSDHGSLDPHIWLSPPLVKQQARTILGALQQADPVHWTVYENNYLQFMRVLDELDAELRALFAQKASLQFMVFHPAWGYFAQAYNLQQIPVEVEGKDPKPAQLQTLIEHARKAGIHVIFVQPQFPTRSAELVAREIDGRVVFANPLAEDWPTNLRTVAAEFKAALK